MLSRRAALAGLGVALFACPSRGDAMTGCIEYPRNKWVFQKAPMNDPSFMAAWRGDGEFVRVKNAAGTIVHTSDATGAVPTLDPGWYTLELMAGTTVLDIIGFGIGNVHVVQWQSNALSWNPAPGTEYAAYAAYASAANKCIIFDTELNRLVDAVNYCRMGAIWIHACNYVNRAYPMMFVMIARSATSSSDWVNNPLFSDIGRAVKVHNPVMINSLGGEADGNDNPATLGNLYGMIESVKQLAGSNKWLMALNSYPPTPNCGLRQAQAAMASYFPNLVYTGPDCDTVGRIPDNPHFHPANYQQLGQLWGARWNELYV